jgi:hypothetical protein
MGGAFNSQRRWPPRLRPRVRRIGGLGIGLVLWLCTFALTGALPTLGDADC